MYVVLFISLYFEVFLLITFFESHGAIQPSLRRKDYKNLPSATVVVPCWNEEHTVAGTLNSLLALTYPKNKLHIIAVNDGSTDNTAVVLNTFASHSQVTVIHKENGGKHTAMNAAFEHTTTAIIGCLDADSYVEPDALLYIAAHFKNKDVAAVTPSIKIYHPRSLIQILQKAEYGLAIFVRNAFAHIDALFITPGPFSFFRVSDIIDVGPWRHGHSTEDLEMCLRLQQAHKKITNEPRAIVHTTSPHTFKALYHQRVRWTFGFLKNAGDYSHMFFNPRYSTLGMFILPLSFVTIFSATFLFGALLWNTSLGIAEQFVRFKTVGITAPVAHFDLFYVHTNVLITIVLALVMLTTTLMVLGKRMSNDPLLSFDIPLYIALYGFLTPVWLAGSLYKAATQRTVRWR